MNVPITLVLLAAVGHVASRCTTGKCADHGQTTKRELLEGNYGQRIPQPNKFAPKNAPGIEYTHNLQRELSDTMVAEQIFGVRLHHIPKISDLLTDNGPPFDVALAHHLYAPVSVYNARFQPLTSQWYYQKPAEAVNTNIFYDPKTFKQQKTLSEEDNHLKSNRPTQNQDQDRYTSYPKPDYQFKTDSAPGYSSQQLRTPDEPQRSVPYSAFVQPVRDLGQRQPSNQFLQQPNIGPIESGVDYEKQFNKDDKNEHKEQGELQKVEATGRPEPKKEPSTPAQGYHAHPNGAVSYANFIHNHPHSYYIQDALQQQFQQTSEIPQQLNENKLNNPNNIQTPQSQILKQSQERNLAPPENQQQYFFDPQHQYYPEHNVPQPYVEPEQPFSAPFVPVAPVQYKPQVYLNPIRQHLLHELQKEHDLQSLKMQQHSLLKPLTNSGPKLVYKVESTTYSPITPKPSLIEQPRGNTIRFPDQPSTQTSISQLNFTPAPTTATYKPHFPIWSSQPSTWGPELAITPKPRIPHDQIVQATTIEPETLKDSYKNEQAAPEPLDVDTSKLKLLQPTLESLLVTPLTLQTLSPKPSEFSLPTSPSTPKAEAPTPRSETTYIQTTPQHSVQIQQQELQEIHSVLKPQQPDQRQAKQLAPEKERNEHQSLEGIPQEQKVLPAVHSEPTTPDYEIEIAQHVDHSQLPKDLQPVTTGQENTQPIEQNPQEVQPHPENQSERGPIQSYGSFGEPPLNHNVHFFNRFSPFLFPFLNPFQPSFPRHPNTNPKDLLQPEFSQSQHISAFSPVQYFGNYAENIFRNP